MDEELRFAVEMWEPNGSLKRVIAKSSSIVVARSTFESAVAEYPGARLTLCHAGRLVDSTERRQREARSKAQ